MRFPISARPVAARVVAAAALAASGVVLAASMRAPLAPLMKGVLWTLVALCAGAPQAGLYTLLATVPLGSVWGAQVNVGAFSEAMVAAAAVGWLLRYLLRGGIREWPRAALPAALLATVALMSAAVQLAPLRLVFEPGTFAPALWRVLSREYFLDRTTFAPVPAAAAMVEALGLFAAAAVILARRPERLGAALRMLVAGATAAASLTLLRVVAGALRSDAPWSAFLDLMRNIRLNATHGDLNAAGSYYVLTLMVTGGLAASAVAERRVRSLSVVAMAAAIQLAGLWLTGSRTAQAVLALAVLGWIAVLAWRHLGRIARGLVVASAAVLCVLAVMAVLRLSQNQISASSTLHVRVEMARAGFRMLATNPLFGIGVGKFHERSAEFIESPLVLQYYPRGENAHNYFVQLLAELGLAGAVAFTWTLAAILVVSGRAAAGNPACHGLLVGIVAFLLTCLTGHPLLVREVALPFWMACGLLVSAPAPAVAATARRYDLRWAAALAVLAIAALPWRIRQADRTAYLEHVSLGTSGWNMDEDGTKFREFSGTGTFYAPTSASVITCRMRAVGSAPVTIDVRWSGRLGATVMLPDRAWHDVLLRVPPTRTSSFLRLQLDARDPAGAPATVRIGKLSIMRPRVD